jgi:hypothetical protein
MYICHRRDRLAINAICQTMRAAYYVSCRRALKYMKLI